MRSAAAMAGRELIFRSGRMSNLDISGHGVVLLDRSERPVVNVHLGDLEEYVQKKLARGGYGSASEVVREALRAQREREREDDAERRIEAYVLKGIDQGPPDGMSAEDWERRIATARERMSNFIRAGLDQLREGRHVDGATAAAKLRAKQAARRAARSRG